MFTVYVASRLAARSRALADRRVFVAPLGATSWTVRSPRRGWTMCTVTRVFLDALPAQPPIHTGSLAVDRSGMPTLLSFVLTLHGCGAGGTTGVTTGEDGLSTTTGGSVVPGPT